MSAMVEEVVRQRAECDDCDWRGPVRKSHRRALDDAQDHDEERHNPWRTNRTIRNEQGHG